MAAYLLAAARPALLLTWLEQPALVAAGAASAWPPRRPRSSPQHARRGLRGSMLDRVFAEDDGLFTPRWWAPRCRRLVLPANGTTRPSPGRGRRYLVNALWFSRTVAAEAERPDRTGRAVRPSGTMPPGPAAAPAR